ncbi:hypothetical protein CYG49_04800 [Candidatus Saccharibacteria bacterium]|nr:MAG: hypothetical protein CYG49_04800 [Candidatus Saccharibacteria bacterium]
MDLRALREQSREWGMPEQRVTPPSSLRVRPSLDEVCDAIAGEASGKGVCCTPLFAKLVIERMQAYLQGAQRVTPYYGGVAHVEQEDMDNGVHDIMDAFMVDHPLGEPIAAAPVPEPDSAHGLLNGYLSGDGPLINVVHTKDKVRGSVYCAVGFQVVLARG